MGMRKPSGNQGARKAVQKEKRERFAARLSPVQKNLLQRAADLSGRSLTEFVLSAAQIAAEETICQYQVLELTARETEALVAALEHPTHLNPKLVEEIRDRSGHVELRW